jgi:PTH1 family peptidyl-tRNA hydrolase
MIFVAGLGNPGSKYEGTRHNAGFLVVDELVRRWGASLSSDRFGNHAASALVRDSKVHFAKPQKFMNRSGAPLRGLVDYYGGAVEDLVVVHDEVDLAFGTMKIKQSGGHGGHNGLRDIHKHMGSNAYLRVRVGVGRPPEGWETADYVLGRWSGEQKESLDDVVSRAADAVEVLIEQGIEAAMNQFHFREASKKTSTSDVLKTQSAQARVAYGV